MKKRISKKLHKIWLESEVVDLSLMPYWRQKLFDSNDNEPYEICPNNLSNLPDNLKNAILKYDLRYKVMKVSSNEVVPYMFDNGLVVFKFWAQNHPNVSAYTGNNPDVI